MASPYDALLQTLGQQQQGLAGLGSNPLFGMGIGLLSGSMQGQPGRGLQAGLQNMLQIERANQSTALLGMRIKEMQEARQQAAEQKAAQQQLFTDPRAALAAQAGQMDVAKSLEFPKPPTLTNLQKEAEGLYPNDPAAQQAFIREVRLKPETVIEMGQKRPKPSEALNLVGPQGEPPPLDATWADLEQAGYRYQSAAEKKEARTAAEMAGRTQDSIDRYKALLKKTGPEVIPGKDKLELGAAYTDLLMEMKELANLGVLQGADLELMQRQLKDPTALSSQLYGKEALAGQLDLVEDKLMAARKRAEETYGTKAMNRPTPPPGWEVVEE